MTVLQICSPGSHQRADCSLRRGVDAEGCGTLNARDGAVENDRATIPQERQCLLHRKQRSPYIDVEHFVEMLFGDGPKGNKFANAGVGENNIESPLHFGDGLVKTIKVSQLSNVSLNSRNVAADCLHGLVEFPLPTARDENICTLFDEKLCRSQSNPFCPAGDDSDLAFEPFGHCFLRYYLSLCYGRLRCGEPLPNIRDGILVERLVKTMRYVADMRRCQYVVQRPEGVRGRQRLNVEYVDRRAGDLLVPQHADQSLLFDDRPARCVDQPGRWLHSLQLRGPYQAARTAAQHQMDRQDVSPLEQLVLGKQDCARGFGDLGRHVLAPGNHIHSKIASDPRDL